VPADSVYRVFGAAWTGESEVTNVEISVDRGQTWLPTQLLGRPTRYAWQLWEYHWRTPAEAGHYTLMARATDARGRTQPAGRDTHRGSYIITHIQPIEVEVRKRTSDKVESYTI
jgi:hypothetical protein